jgi:hypothetical protein
MESTPAQKPNAEGDQFILDCCLHGVGLSCRKRAGTQRIQCGE